MLLNPGQKANNNHSANNNHHVINVICARLPAYIYYSCAHSAYNGTGSISLFSHDK